MINNLLNRYILIFLVIGLGITSSLYASNPPLLTSPNNGASTWTGVLLDWNAVDSSVGYQLQVDSSSLFNSHVKLNVYQEYINSSSGNPDTQYWLQNLYFGKTYYWRVRAYITGDTSAWSQSSFITRDYVTMLSPSSGALVWAGVGLDWAAHAGVAYYDAEADTTIKFNSPAKKSITTAYINSSDGNNDTYWFLNEIYFGKKYYWRVRARNTVDTSGWSVPWDFITKDYVTMTSPGTGSYVWNGVTLDWAAHPGVDYYEAQVDTSSKFNSPVLRSVTNQYINSSDNGNDTRWYINENYFGKKYYWRVRAMNTVDTTAWSKPWAFTTRNYLTMIGPPAGTSQWNGVYLDWSPHTGVDFYDCEADTSSKFNSPVKRRVSNAYINSSDGNPDTQWYLNEIYFGKTYYWHVRVRNMVDSSTWTKAWTFNTKDYVTLSSPPDGSTNISVSGIILDWAPHPGIDVYQLQLDTTNLFNSLYLMTSNQNYINSSDGNPDTQYSTGNLIHNKVYFWRVRAINKVDSSEWTMWSFTTGSLPVIIPDIPVLITPLNGTTNKDTTITLTWYSSKNATAYDYEISQDINFTSATEIRTNDTTAVVKISAPGNYYWKVRAIRGTSVYSDWTAAWSFNQCGTYIISGYLYYDNTINSPLKNVNLTLTDSDGKTLAATITDTTGHYIFNFYCSGTYTITATSQRAIGGVDPADALLVNRNYIGKYNFTDDLRKTAADVNVDGKRNPTDALLINRYYIKSVTSFKAGKWIFENPSVLIDNSNVQLNFKGVCVGDVNGSYKPK